ncbi:uncharacterized protein LOC126810731 [Patella vulgata]|uniref:uncharacterized protein LOC126810731 n=1 Tax=Patella vulgata TaxID=6465 RepID=UPI00217F74CC|nr:uncharacterized protein LOC126810731 [Patella vulgata]XP_050391925.1 uncharacterized protein LOC126810731 [Patella vulgata]
MDILRECAICNEICYSKAEFINHSKTHVKEEQTDFVNTIHQCRVCGDSFTSASLLEEHVSTAHKHKLEKTDNDDTKATHNNITNLVVDVVSNTPTNHVVRPRRFKLKWLTKFPWLRFDDDSRKMYCQLCEKHQVKNDFVSGSQDYNEEVLTDHERSTDHEIAVDNEEDDDDDHVAKKPQKSKFCYQWLRLFPWLHFDDCVDKMFCKACCKYSGNVRNSFVSGSQNFNRSALLDHEIKNYHKLAINKLENQGDPSDIEACTTTPPAPSPKVRTFSMKWLQMFAWLRYDYKSHKMYCKICSEKKNGRRKNVFVTGSLNYRISALRDHQNSKDHRKVVKMFNKDHDSESQSESNSNIRLEDAGDSSAPNTSTVEPMEVNDVAKLNDDSSEENVSLQKSNESLPKTKESSKKTSESLRKRNELSEKTNELSGKTNELSEKTNESSKKTNESSEKINELSEKTNESSEKTNESSEKTNESSEKTNEFSERPNISLGNRVESSDERTLRTSEKRKRLMEKARESSKKVRESSTPRPRNTRYFKLQWLTKFPWLRYEENSNKMYCQVCEKHELKYKSEFISGTQTFTISRLYLHSASMYHKVAMDKDDRFNKDKHEKYYSKKGNKSGNISSKVLMKDTKSKPSSAGMSPKSSQDSEKVVQPELTSSTTASASTVSNDVSMSSNLPEDFNFDWLTIFPWLRYDNSINKVYCQVCEKHGLKNEYVSGSENYGEGALLNHAVSDDHETAINDDPGKKRKRDDDEDESRATKRPQQRRFNPKWLKDFPWVRFDKSTQSMFCKICRKHCNGDGAKSKWITGSTNFRTSGMWDHEFSGEHKSAALKEGDISPDEEEEEEEEEEETPPTPDGSTLFPSKRKFSPHWLASFPWLRYNATRNIMFCKICEEFGNNKKLTFVIGSQNFRKSNLWEHKMSSEHNYALDRSEGKNTPQPLTKIKLKQQNEELLDEVDQAMLTIIRNLYFISKENIAIDKFERLNELSALNGSPMTSKLYRHYYTASEFVKLISDDIEDSIINDVRSSPVFGILLNDSLVLPPDKHLILYISFIKDGILQTRFVRLLEADCSSAESITTSLLAFLHDSKIDVKKLFGIGSDGDAVMIDQDVGVYSLFKKQNPLIVDIILCSDVINRLASAIVDTIKSCNDVSSYENILDSLISYMRKLPDELCELCGFQDFLDESKVKPSEVNRSRLQILTGGVLKLEKNFPYLIKILQTRSDKKHASESLYTKLTTYNFVFYTTFLHDLLISIENLNTMLKATDFPYTDAVYNIDKFIQSLKNTYFGEVPGYGPKLTQFLNETEQAHIYYDLHLTKGKNDHYLGIQVRQTIQTLIDNINDKFPNNDIMAAFCVFSPPKIPEMEELENYGCKEIGVLLDHFGNSVPRGNDSMIIERSSAEKEWPTFRTFMAEKSPGLSYLELLSKVSQEGLSKQFPNMTRLMEIGLVIPSSSAVFQQGFTRQNVIKTKLRSCMTLKTLDELMRISMEGPTLQNFDPTSVLLKWKSKRNRRVYQGNIADKIICSVTN